MSRLDGKVAIVTGGGSGLGRASALLFAREGARVAVVDLDGDAAQAVADEVVEAGGKALAVQTDVASARDAARLVEETVAGLGALHVLYNNAGVNSSGGVVEGTEDDWDRCLAVNAKGTFLCSQAAVPAIAEAGGGAIVNQGSVAALVGVANFAAYSAAKGAVVALTRAMAVELAPLGIRVNVLCPGTVATPLMEPLLRARGGGDLDKGLALTAEKYPLGRLGAPEEIAQVACFLASDDAAFVTGAVYTVDGGMTAQ
jgi:NAD(P)-dependent dehydrogenase (short-subunit alcohol dehydrogenase family)